MPDKPRVQKIALLSLVSAFMALLIWRLEWVEREVDDGPSDKAKRNPFLASQRLLEHHGVAHFSQDGFIGLERSQWRDEPLGQRDTLILVNTYHNLHQHQITSLWRWVEAGGRLIVSIENPFIGSGEHLRDELLARMELTLHPSATQPKDDLAAEELPEQERRDNIVGLAEPDAPKTNDYVLDAAEDQQHCAGVRSTAYVRLSENEPELAISVSGNHHLSVDSDNSQILAGDKQAAYLVRRPAGAGEIYAITSTVGWRNTNIGCDDNAYLFWRLTSNSTAVRYAINQSTPSFWRYLWQLSAVGCFALLLALAFWLWTRATRFGPVLGRPEPGRRRFAEHIHAGGQFILRHGGEQMLVQILREDVNQRLERRHPGFARLSRAEQTKLAQNLSGCDPRTVQVALHHLPAQSPLLDIGRCLQQLRSHI